MAQRIEDLLDNLHLIAAIEQAGRLEEHQHEAMLGSLGSLSLQSEHSEKTLLAEKPPI